MGLDYGRGFLQCSHHTEFRAHHFSPHGLPCSPSTPLSSFTSDFFLLFVLELKEDGSQFYSAIGTVGTRADQSRQGRPHAVLTQGGELLP